VEIVAIVVGLVAGGGAVLALLRRRQRPGDEGQRSRARIDPFAVGEPWRHHVLGAQSAQRRYAAIVGTVQDGPLRTRMAEIGRQVHHSVEECWEIAQRGHALDGTLRSLDGPRLRARHEAALTDAERASLQGQLDTYERIRAARDQTDARLRQLQSRLGEVVSRGAEVSAGVDAVAEIGSAIEDVVLQLEALSQAVDEVNTTGRSAGFELGGPGTTSPAT